MVESQESTPSSSTPAAKVSDPSTSPLQPSTKQQALPAARRGQAETVATHSAQNHPQASAAVQEVSTGVASTSADRTSEPFAGPGLPTDMSADEWKKRGNDAFSAQRYNDAIVYYSNGIELEPTNPALFSNRSAAYLKLEDYSKARQDASMCIDLDKHWAKGYWRLGQAQLDDQDYYGARDTFKKGLSYCEHDDNLKRGLDSAEKRIQVIEKVQGPSESALGKFDIDGTSDWSPPESKPSSNPDNKDSLPESEFPGSAEEEIERISSAPNHYAVLHVSPDSSNAEMKKNYHALARMLHPDKCQLPGSSEAMAKVALAYETLTNVVKRTLYDQYVSQTSNSPDGKGTTYAEWEASQQPVDLPKWLRWLLGIRGCGWVLAIVTAFVMLPILLLLALLFLILWLIFLPYRFTLRHCFPERYARMREEAEKERVRMEELAQDRQFATV